VARLRRAIRVSCAFGKRLRLDGARKEYLRHGAVQEPTPARATVLRILQAIAMYYKTDFLQAILLKSFALKSHQ